MLVIFYGTSCVGKTTLMKYLKKNYEWKIIPTYMTRLVREEEEEKFHVTVKELIEGEARGDFLQINNCYGNYYGTPTKELKIAETDKEYIWCLDYPLQRKDLIKEFNYCGIILLPESKEQLINQINNANRNERMQDILNEYEKCYQSDFDSSFYTVINYPNEIKKTCDIIVDIVKKYRR